MQVLAEIGAMIFKKLCGLLGWMLGGFDNYICALTVFVILGCFTGIMAAGVNQRFSAKAVCRSIAKGTCIFIIVSIANIVDMVMIKNGSAARTLVIIFYLSREGLLILKNAADIGIEIPKPLQNMLKQINKESGEG